MITIVEQAVSALSSIAPSIESNGSSTLSISAPPPYPTVVLAKVSSASDLKSPRSSPKFLITSSGWILSTRPRRRTSSVIVIRGLRSDEKSRRFRILARLVAMFLRRMVRPLRLL
uniref:Uncharacterized protein n=1 Tax=Brassica oleracea TaxID=3712 RepID=A0A3P6DQ30_BRAOL|nr:unnamed protein product [Brassica oleracea]